MNVCMRMQVFRLCARERVQVCVRARVSVHVWVCVFSGLSFSLSLTAFEHTVVFCGQDLHIDSGQDLRQGDKPFTQTGR